MLTETNKNFTPGPWRWELNEKHSSINLCGGKSPFDLTVMGFCRYGMNSAQPEFRVNDFMVKSSKLGAIAKGREHHSHWFKLIDNPDANLIAAAPELLEELKNIVNQLKSGVSPQTEQAEVLINRFYES